MERRSTERTAMNQRLRRARRREWLEVEGREFLKGSAKLDRWSRRVKHQWVVLQDLCTDRGSRVRLGRLIHRLLSHDRGVRESALAELELATQLIRAGFTIRFLPEAQARTADLEGRRGETRIFFEVTALVGSGRHLGLAALQRRRHDEDGPRAVGQAVIDRLTARIAQKSKQLGDYAAPVMLAMSVPKHEPGVRPDEPIVDLKKLAGTVTVLLLGLKQLSGVLITLWDLEAAPVQSGIRLANVHLVERSRHQSASPRVRLLIANPGAEFPLETADLEVLNGLV